MKDVVAAPMRSVILWLLALCAAVAMAPWLSGGEEPLARLIGGGALLLGALFMTREPVVRRFSAGPLLWTYLALATWGSLSLLWTANRYSTVIWIVNIVTAGLAFRLAYTVAGEKDGRERLVRLYVVSAVAFCAYGIYLFITGDYNRLTSAFYWANPAAAYLLPTVFIGLDRIDMGGRQRWIWILLTAVVGSSFILTDSRAATLVLGILMVLFLILHKAKKGFWIHFLFTVIATVVLTSIFIQARATAHAHLSASAVIAPGSRFAEAATGESRSFSDRFNYLTSAVDIWENSPLGGTGAGTYGDVHPKYQRTVVSAATSAHNVYVQTLAELGIVGFLLLLGLVVILLVGSFRGLVGDPTALPIFFGLVALLLHFGLDIDAHYPALLLLGAVLAGIIYEQRYRDPAHASWRLLVASALLLVPLISLYQSDVWASKARAAQNDGDYPLASAYFANAHHGVVYNPDTLGAEGIDYYTVALGGGSDAKAASALALEKARAAQRQDPSDAQHHQLEGRVLWLMGDKVGAEAAFQQALRLDPYNHPDYAFDLASLQAAEGRLTDALITAKDMLALYPADVIANRNADAGLAPSVASLAALLGNIQLRNGDIKAAQASADLSVKIDPKNVRGRALEVQVHKIGL